MNCHTHRKHRRSATHFLFAGADKVIESGMRTISPIAVPCFKLGPAAVSPVNGIIK
jgi:hypothetical protein